MTLNRRLSSEHWLQSESAILNFKIPTSAFLTQSTIHSLVTILKTLTTALIEKDGSRKRIVHTFNYISWSWSITYLALSTKGQLILKCPFGVFKSPKKLTNFFSGFLTLLFWFDFFLEARAEILGKKINWMEYNHLYSPSEPHFRRSVNFEMPFWCLQISQKTNEIFSRISALASKKKSNQKSSVRESK